MFNFIELSLVELWCLLFAIGDGIWKVRMEIQLNDQKLVLGRKGIRFVLYVIVDV